MESFDAQGTKSCDGKKIYHTFAEIAHSIRNITAYVEGRLTREELL